MTPEQRQQKAAYAVAERIAALKTRLGAKDAQHWREGLRKHPMHNLNKKEESLWQK